MRLRLLLLLVIHVSPGSILVGQAQPFTQTSQSGSGPANEYGNLQTLASRLLEHPGDADCQKHKCKLLVLDFVTSDNRGSVYGRQLADQLAAEFAKQDRKIEVMDRARLHAYLEKERITLTQNDGVSRAVGADLNATTVVLCSLGRIDDNTMEASGRMLSVGDSSRSGNREHVDLLAPVSEVNLKPVEIPSLPPYQHTANGEPVYRPSPKGASLPHCTYMPNPPYSEGARKARVNGVLMAEAIIGTDGQLDGLRIIRGLPGGLNENALTTMSTWRCRPAIKDGQPVSVAVTFEVNFRLY